jgi:hypothetical protein
MDMMLNTMANAPGKKATIPTQGINATMRDIIPNTMPMIPITCPSVDVLG